MLFVFAMTTMTTTCALSIGPWGPILDLSSSPPMNDVLWMNADGSSRILPIAELPPRPDGHRRIVAISDTHGKHRFVPIPPCDILCHCGDILQRYGYLGDLGGALPALLDFCSWLGEVPATNSVVIGGNHDRLLEKMGDTAVQTILKWRSEAIYLHDDSVQLADLVLYGSPWSPPGKTGNRAFQQRRGSDATADASKEVSLALRCEHPRVDVLLTHASCIQWDTVVQTKGTAFWAHGHWHDGHGQTKIHKNGCLSVNVASNDRLYRPRNPPTVFDVPVDDDTNRTTARG